MFDRHIHESAAIIVSAIVSEWQLHWSPVHFFLDGLRGPLARGEVYVDRGADGADGAGLVGGLLGLERAFFSAGRVQGNAIDSRPLPARAADMAACDVIVDFRSSQAPTGLCVHARFGVWTLSCRDHAQIFAALARGASALECRLYSQTGDGPRRSIAIATVQGKHALSPTLTFAAEKSVQLALRELKRLTLLQALPPGVTDATEQTRPHLADFARYGTGIVRLGLVRAAERLRPSRGHGSPFGLRTGKGSLTDIDPAAGTDVQRPDETFCADPFLLERDGAVYCFYEEFHYASGLGKIAVALLTDAGAERLGDALIADHHLSFPFVFAHEGEIFMMPETIQARRIEIWRCTDFPLGWVLHTTAFEGQQLADPVLFHRGEEWWLFANTSHDSFGDFSSELHLYRVDGPELKQIAPHPLNPVVVGSDVARGGGRVFEQEGRIYRYSQDNSGNIYGHGLNLMEITELSETDYAERRVAHFTPDGIRGAVGCHHANAAAGRFVVDVRLG